MPGLLKDECAFGKASSWDLTSDPITAATKARPCERTPPEVVKACILLTTWYLHDAVAGDRAAGHEIGDAIIAHLIPARFEAVNPMRY